MLTDYEHHIVTFDADAEFRKKFENVAFVHLKSSRKIITVSNIFFLQRIEKKIKPLIIHAHLLKTNWLSRMAFHKKEKLFNSIHSQYSKDAFGFHAYSLWLEKYSYNLSNVKLIFVSPYVKEDYENYIHLKRENYILPNFVTNDFFETRQLKYTPHEPLYLLAVGNVKKLKNYGLLIEVFKKLKDYPIHLDVYGNGDLLAAFKSEVEKHSLKINFRGIIDSVADRLGNHHALVFPSFLEGFSIALLEAMAASTPLILSDIPMFKNLAKDNAYFFNPESSEECKDAILKFYKEGCPDSAIIKNQQYVKEHYTGTVYKKNINDIYLNLK
ncbi:MAG: glycosyltransferase family 4 protein [Bacteroidota bacterium]|nr:glycosyltransferase family 4 protein [Bacteroidota bacterium]